MIFESNDPSWFPFNYIEERDSFRCGKVDLVTIGQTSFMDRRMPHDPGTDIFIDARPELWRLPPGDPSLLFHTAFCGSTLLARALHSPPRAVALKEPSVLVDLSAASLRPGEIHPDQLDARLQVAVDLLSRAWSTGGRVLIKPTNQVNRLVSIILRARPTARALFLHSTLEDFLVSCLKKMPLAESRIRWMAQHLLVGTDLCERLKINPFQAFNLPESCVLTWYAQVEHFTKAIHNDATDNIRTLEFKVLLNRSVACVKAAAEWLKLEIPVAGFNDRVAGTFRLDSKSTGRGFDQRARAAESDAVLAVYGELISRTLRWAHDEIQPHAYSQATWKPLMIKQ